MANNPEFVVYCGGMFSQKTTKLLLHYERYKFQNKKIIAFKPKVDTRYAHEQIVSHMNWTIDAIAISDGSELLNALLNDEKEYDAVFVDEAFMIPKISNVLKDLYKLGISVIIASLDLSSQGESFQEIEKILPFATKIEKCASVCEICGKDAFYSYRKTSSEDQIFIGAADHYGPRCFAHFPQINKRD